MEQKNYSKKLDRVTLGTVANAVITVRIFKITLFINEGLCLLHLTLQANIVYMF